MSGLPSPWDDAPRVCEQCDEIRDTTGQLAEWHEDYRRYLHPDCVGNWIADSLPEEPDLPEPWQDPNTKRETYE